MAHDKAMDAQNQFKGVESYVQQVKYHGVKIISYSSLFVYLVPGIVLNHRQYPRYIWRINASDLALSEWVPTCIHFMKDTPNHIKSAKDLKEKMMNCSF